jgi:hypothetical protein
MATDSTNIHVGDKVWIPLVAGRICGTITEDRGPLGADGSRLFRVVVPNDPYQSDEFTVQEEEITPLAPAELATLQKKLSTGDIAQFLISGGLIAILVRNSPERVWLRRDANGNIAFTYVEDYGVVGGRPAPQFALFGESIFEPQKNSVLDFIRSFGLNRQQAEQVIDAVGVGF